jgi:hypothetical protein
MEREGLIRDFWRFLEKAKDDKKSLSHSIEYLNALLRNKTCIPPTIEIMTIIKKDRPILFQHLKQRISNTSPLRMLLQLEMPYEDAKQRLTITTERSNHY